MNTTRTSARCLEMEFVGRVRRIQVMEWDGESCRRCWWRFVFFLPLLEDIIKPLYASFEVWHLAKSRWKWHDVPTDDYNVWSRSWTIWPREFEGVSGRGESCRMAGGLTIYSSVGNISFPWVFYVFWSVITIINVISSDFSHLKNPLSRPPFFLQARRFFKWAEVYWFCRFMEPAVLSSPWLFSRKVPR